MSDFKFDPSKYKYLTQHDKYSWYIQSIKESITHSYHVCTTHDGYIIMTGDYNGVMVKPCCCRDALPSWMASATTLSYFVEKVKIANQYHKCYEYSEEAARENLIEIREIFIASASDIEFRRSYTPTYYEEIKEYDYITNDDLTTEEQYFDILSNIMNAFDTEDLYGYNAEVVTYQLKLQHQCLLHWANMVLQDKFSKKYKSNLIQPPQPIIKKPENPIGKPNSQIIINKNEI